MGGTDSAASEMKVDVARAATLAANVQAVQERIAAAAAGRSVRLVAVSKLKPANDILALHQGPCQLTHFGENYAQELRDKAALLPRTIQWHFIGGLQSGHCKNLARIPNLWCVSSVDAVKKARLLNDTRATFQAVEARVRRDAQSAAAGSLSASPSSSPIHVHVQVNTSGEDSKSGCAPGPDTLELCRTIVEECPHLRLLGLMTIGAIARSRATGTEGGEDNPDFVALRQQRDLVEAALADAVPADPALASPRAQSTPSADGHWLELSMGMSEDFVGAIAAGSGEVRVGSTIFGLRPAKADAQLTI